DFLDLERCHVAIVGEAGRDARYFAPPVWCVALHQDLLALDNKIRGADRPRPGVGPLLRRRHVGRIAARRAVVDPLRNRRDVVVAERWIVLELLDAEVLLDVPRRHYAGSRSDAGALLDGAGPRPYLVVGNERHRRHTLRAVAVLAAALKNRRDVF